MWPAGCTVATVPLLVAAVALLAGARPPGSPCATCPSAWFLVLALALGGVVLTLAHLGPVRPRCRRRLTSLLDGLLVAFRNVHKVDPLVRLPLAAAGGPVGRLLRCSAGGGCSGGARRRRGAPRPARGGVSRGLGGVAPRGPSPTWRALAAGGAWLSVPAGTAARSSCPPRFGTYFWGPTVDEPLRPLTATVRRARCRAAHPAGTIRVLDAVEERLRRAGPRPGVEVLRRLGVATSSCATTSTRHPPASPRSPTRAPRSARRPRSSSPVGSGRPASTPVESGSSRWRSTTSARPSRWRSPCR